MSGSKSVFGDFLKYVSLNILGQMAYSCYTLADTFFVSASLGTDGLTALNLAFPVFCLMNGTGLMIGMGGATIYAIAKSRGEAAKANQIFTNAVYMVICLAVLYVAAGLFWSDRLVTLLGADSRLFSPTNTYLKVMLLFAPAFLTNTLLQCFVRNDGQPSLSMAAMIIGSISNILLDYLFIFPLRLGILGAILATGLSPLISIGIPAVRNTGRYSCHRSVSPYQYRYSVALFCQKEKRIPFSEIRSEYPKSSRNHSKRHTAFYYGAFFGYCYVFVQFYHPEIRRKYRRSSLWRDFGDFFGGYCHLYRTVSGHTASPQHPPRNGKQERLTLHKKICPDYGTALILHHLHGYLLWGSALCLCIQQRKQRNPSNACRHRSEAVFLCLSVYRLQYCNCHLFCLDGAHPPRSGTFPSERLVCARPPSLPAVCPLENDRCMACLSGNRGPCGCYGCGALNPD